MVYCPYFLGYLPDLRGLFISLGVILEEEEFSTWSCIANQGSFLVLALK